MLSKSIKPYRFSIEENEIFNYTINIFEKAGFRRYRLPEVFYGDFHNFRVNKQKVKADICSDESRFDIDYLGMYVYKLNQEGQIHIFKDRIYECSKEIADKLNLHRFEVHNDILLIVLLHEIGHWLTHFCHQEKEEKRSKNYKLLSNTLKETMAQLTVIWSLNKATIKYKERIMLIFNYLVDHQTEPYQAFRKLGKDLNNFKKILKGFLYALDIKKNKLSFSPSNK